MLVLLWIVLTVISVFIWAATNIFDKYLMSNKVLNSSPMIFRASIVGPIAGLAIIAYFGETIAGSGYRRSPCCRRFYCPQSTEAIPLF